jgi:hypothetical protein
MFAEVKALVPPVRLAQHVLAVCWATKACVHCAVQSRLEADYEFLCYMLTLVPDINQSLWILKASESPDFETVFQAIRN